MNSVLIYIIQSTVSLTIFYGFYELLFKREAYFGFNRYYLLFAIIISAALPFINFNIYQIFSNGSEGILLAAPVYSLVEYSLGEVIIYGGSKEVANSTWLSNGISFFEAIMLIYFAGIFFALSRFCFRLYQLSQFLRQSEVTIHRGLRFVYTEPGTPVFSFLNYLFIDKELFENSGEVEKIIQHEKIHINQKHSLDLIVAEIITIIQWFNPLAYLLKKSLKENHEFIADNMVIAAYPDVISYSRLLIENSSIVKTNILTHNFSYSLLKRRLFMIKKTKNPLQFSLKLVWVLLALNMVFFACSGPVQKDEIDTSSQSVEKVHSGEDETFTVVEIAPVFPGGMEKLFQYLANNIEYPQVAKEKGIEGRVFVNFIVDNDGSIDSVKVLRGIGSGCDEEAVRVVSAMPKWKPGMQRGKPVRVSYNIPIKFALDNKVADSVYTLVEVMPEYPGGINALMSYLSKNIKYPETAKKAGVQGRVFVSFIVEKDGRVNESKILRGIGAGCDEEALRVVNSMPKWKPGLSEGKPVRVQYNLPIKFQLQ